MFNFRTVDLNLLGHLNVLLQESHVTRSAGRIGMSQSAMSNALERGRHLFGDPLLVRVGGEMRLTPRAQILAPQLSALMHQVEIIIRPAPPDIRNTRQTVRLLMAHVMAVMLGPTLYQRVRETAPGVTLTIQAWNGSREALKGLEKGDIDLALSTFSDLDAKLRCLTVVEESFVVIMRKGHPAADGFDVGKWLAWPHLIFSGHGETRDQVDDILQTLGLFRKVAMVAPSYSMAAELVADSDLICLTPRGAISDEWTTRLEVLRPPLALPGVSMQLAWHARADEDIVVRHVAHLVQEILRPLIRSGEAPHARLSRLAD